MAQIFKMDGGECYEVLIKVDFKSWIYLYSDFMREEHLASAKSSNHLPNCSNVLQILYKSFLDIGIRLKRSTKNMDAK